MDDRAAYAKVHQRLRVVEDKLRRVKSRERIRDVGRGMMNQFSTFNVIHFGAVGDGVTDDRAAIVNAIDALTAKGGGYLYFPGGGRQYLINDDIEITSDNCHVICPDGQAEIISGGAWVGFTIFYIDDKDNVTFEGLKFDLSSNNQNALYYDGNFAHARVVDCQFNNFGDAAIYMAGSTTQKDYIWLLDNYFNNCGYAVVLDAPYSHVHMERLISLSTNTQGITVSALAANGYYLSIEDCVIEGGADPSGLEVIASGSHNYHHYRAKIERNVVYQAYRGIEIDHLVDSVVSENASIEADATDNSIEEWGFYLGFSDFVRFEENVCTLSDKRGFMWEDVRYSTAEGNIAIDNNVLNRADNDGLGGFDLVTDTTGCDYNLFVGNISGNITASGNQDYGWGEYNAGGASASDHNWLVDNVFIGNDTGPVLIRGANTVARNNKGFKTEETGTATIAAGTAAITVNTGIDTSITLTQEMIQVTPHDNMTPAVRFWVTNIVNQSFDINTDANVTGNTDFAYYVTVYRS